MMVRGYPVFGSIRWPATSLSRSNSPGAATLLITSTPIWKPASIKAEPALMICGGTVSRRRLSDMARQGPMLLRNPDRWSSSLSSAMCSSLPRPRGVCIQGEFTIFPTSWGPPPSKHGAFFLPSPTDSLTPPGQPITRWLSRLLTSKPGRCGGILLLLGDRKQRHLRICQNLDMFRFRG
jgi:hypothetical protein